jgi:hypothetical protein
MKRDVRKSSGNVGGLQILQKFLYIVLLVTTLIYPVTMAMLSAAGWQYNVKAGNYPRIFAVYAFWMGMGGMLLTISAVLCRIGKKCRFWRCNVYSLMTGCIGIAACMTVLNRFCVYADQNFSGIGESMQPVSELYCNRLLPMLLPWSLETVLTLWQLFSAENRAYRRQECEKRKALKNAEAPKILGE